MGNLQTLAAICGECDGIRRYSIWDIPQGLEHLSRSRTNSGDIRLHEMADRDLRHMMKSSQADRLLDVMEIGRRRACQDFGAAPNLHTSHLLPYQFSVPLTLMLLRKTNLTSDLYRDIAREDQESLSAPLPACPNLLECFWKLEMPNRKWS